MISRNEVSYIFKLLLVGDSMVGKSSILARYDSNSFSAEYESTISAILAEKTQSVSGKKIDRQLWDTSGLLRYKNIVSIYYPRSEAVIIVFDLTDFDSFVNIKEYLREAQAKAPGASIFLVGNKHDLQDERIVGQSAIDYFVADKDNNISGYFAVSAKTGYGINEMFSAVTEDFMKKNNLVSSESKEVAESESVFTSSYNNNQVDRVRLLSSNNSNSDPTPKEVLVARLEKYIKRIDSYCSYRDGFWFDKQTRAQNRRANEALARGLLKALNESDGSVDAINAVFQDINQKREKIIENLGLRTKGRGINSAELSQVIERAGYFVKRGF